MAVSQKGWATLIEANDYFEEERLATDHWDALTDNDDKMRALNFAYNRIYYSPDYSVPAKGDETAAEKIILIKAQSEMAYYAILHVSDEDRRKGLQAQAVTTAGIVKEVYDKDRAAKIPIPPIVEELLAPLIDADLTAMTMIDLDRDENESVDTKVDDF